MNTQAPDVPLSGGEEAHLLDPFDPESFDHVFGSEALSTFWNVPDLSPSGSATTDDIDGLLQLANEPTSDPSTLPGSSHFFSTHDAGFMNTSSFTAPSNGWSSDERPLSRQDAIPVDYDTVNDGYVDPNTIQLPSKRLKLGPLQDQTVPSVMEPVSLGPLWGAAPNVFEDQLDLLPPSKSMSNQRTTNTPISSDDMKHAMQLARDTVHQKAPPVPGADANSQPRSSKKRKVQSPRRDQVAKQPLMYRFCFDWRSNGPTEPEYATSSKKRDVVQQGGACFRCRIKHQEVRLPSRTWRTLLKSLSATEEPLANLVAITGVRF